MKSDVNLLKLQYFLIWLFLILITTFLDVVMPSATSFDLLLLRNFVDTPLHAWSVVVLIYLATRIDIPALVLEKWRDR